MLVWKGDDGGGDREMLSGPFLVSFYIASSVSSFFIFCIYLLSNKTRCLRFFDLFIGRVYSAITL